jgi:transcriptional regulator with XRE-family HTH domain
MSSAGTRDTDGPVTDGQAEAARVRELRARSGLSQEQLAARLGVSPVTVSRWENGRSGMSAAARQRLRQLEQADPARPTQAGAPQAGALPVPPSSFVGRESEIAALTALLAASRLVSLIGPGGAGKTRLALEVLRRRPADNARVVFAAMDQLSDPALVDARVATALGIRDLPGVPAAAAITESLTAQPALLVLDGAEHVLTGVAALVQRVLAGAGARLPRPGCGAGRRGRQRRGAAVRRPRGRARAGFRRH